MRNRERSFGKRLGRGLILIGGLLGALAAVDALLLFSVLLLAAIFIDVPNPYIGLVIFLGLPFTAVFGGALAWTAYTVLMDGAPESDITDLRVSPQIGRSPA
jgi:predicted membrane metal-binding protein